MPNPLEERISKLERKLENIHESVHGNRMCIKDNEKDIALVQKDVKTLCLQIKELSLEQKDAIIESKEYRKLLSERRENELKKVLSSSWTFLILILGFIFSIIKYVVNKYFDITFK